MEEIEVDVLDDTLDSERARVLLAGEDEASKVHEITPSQRAALNEEGRRLREREAYEVRWKALLAKVDEVVGPLRPAERVRLGLDNAARGLVEGRELHERLAHELDRVRTDLVDGEARLRSLSTEARAARIPRVRGPYEEAGPKRLPRDVLPPVTVRTPMDAQTRESLRLMGLAPARQMALMPPRASVAPSDPASVAPQASGSALRSFVDRLVDRILYRTPEPTRRAKLNGMAQRHHGDAS